MKYKHYIDLEREVLPTSILYNIAMNKDATQEMRAMEFEIKIIKKLKPKPSNLIKHLIKIGADLTSYVLDFFALS